jgi:hypothetical protein
MKQRQSNRGTCPPLGTSGRVGWGTRGGVGLGTMPPRDMGGSDIASTPRRFFRQIKSRRQLGTHLQNWVAPLITYRRIGPRGRRLQS